VLSDDLEQVIVAWNAMVDPGEEGASPPMTRAMVGATVVNGAAGCRDEINAPPIGDSSMPCSGRCEVRLRGVPPGALTFCTGFVPLF